MSFMSSRVNSQQISVCKDEEEVLLLFKKQYKEGIGETTQM